MSLTPALDLQKAQKRKDDIEKCGKNGGPHDYMPIEWRSVEQSTSGVKFNRVTRLLCRICFSNVSMQTLLENYPDVSYTSKRDDISQ